MIKITTRKHFLQEYIAQIIFYKDSQWKVTDIDDYMNGNDLIEIRAKILFINFNENRFMEKKTLCIKISFYL